MRKKTDPGHLVLGPQSGQGPEAERALWFFTDGACAGNPGPGGWGVVMRQSSDRFLKSGFASQTTNNRMEMTAVLEALIWAGNLWDGGAVHLVSDSQYVIKGVTLWVKNWQTNGWQTSQKKPVENQDLWKEIVAKEAALGQVGWHWVRGHSGHPDNEAADRLAVTALKQGVKGSEAGGRGD